MELIRNTDDVWPDGAPRGTFDIDDCTLEDRPSVIARIHYVCPNGKRCGVFLGPQAESRRSEDEPNVWAWNGDYENPSLQPSINCISEKDGKPTSGCGWHGFITAGEFK